MEMNIEHINPFLVATKSVLRDMCGVDLAVGTPYVKKEKFNEDTAVDDLSLSALCEVGIMFFGNAATVLSTKCIIIDITPPTVIQGNFSIANNFAQNVCIPFKFDGDKSIEVDVSVKEA